MYILFTAKGETFCLLRLFRILTRQNLGSVERKKRATPPAKRAILTRFGYHSGSKWLKTAQNKFTIFFQATFSRFSGDCIFVFKICQIVATIGMMDQFPEFLAEFCNLAQLVGTSAELLHGHCLSWQDF